LLPGGANQFPGGIFPAVDQRLFTAHAKVRLALVYLAAGALLCGAIVMFFQKDCVKSTGVTTCSD
jgi:hypothetical protein